MDKQLVPVETGDDFQKALAVVTTNVAYLPRLQLFGSKSDACAEGKIDIGHWGLVNDDVIIDLGEEVDVVVLAFRPKALQTGGENIITNYDPQSEVFKQIREQSTVKDSGCMYGPEFLMYIPDSGVFATYFASSKTARREAKKFAALLGKAATLRCKLIDPPASKYKWHGPVVLPCSSPVELPEMEVINTEIEKFKNPPVDETELAPEDKDSRQR